MEEWKVIEFEPRYEVSNMGRVRNRNTSRMLATNPTKSHKRPQVWLYNDYHGTTCQYSLAKVVLSTFNQNVDMWGTKCVYHRDGDIMNCKLENLYVK